MKITRIYDLPQKCWVFGMVFWFSQQAHLYNICPQWKRKQHTDLFLCFVKYKSTRKKDFNYRCDTEIKQCACCTCVQYTTGRYVSITATKMLIGKRRTVLFCLSITKHAFFLSPGQKYIFMTYEISGRDGRVIADAEWRSHNARAARAFTIDSFQPAHQFMC